MFSKSTLSSCFPSPLEHTVSSSPAQPSLLTAEILGGASSHLPVLPKWLGCGKWIPSFHYTNFHNTGGHSFTLPIITSSNPQIKQPGGRMVNPIS